MKSVRLEASLQIHSWRFAALSRSWLPVGPESRYKYHFTFLIFMDQMLLRCFATLFLPTFALKLVNKYKY